MVLQPPAVRPSGSTMSREVEPVVPLPLRPGAGFGRFQGLCKGRHENIWAPVESVPALTDIQDGRAGSYR